MPLLDDNARSISLPELNMRATSKNLIVQDTVECPKQVRKRLIDRHDIVYFLQSVKETKELNKSLN